MEKSTESILPSLLISTYLLLNGGLDSRSIKDGEKSIEFIFVSQLKSVCLQLPVTESITEAVEEPPPPPPPPPPLGGGVDVGATAVPIREAPELSVPKYTMTLK